MFYNIEDFMNLFTLDQDSKVVVNISKLEEICELGLLHTVVNASIESFNENAKQNKSTQVARRVSFDSIWIFNGNEVIQIYRAFLNPERNDKNKTLALFEIIYENPNHDISVPNNIIPLFS